MACCIANTSFIRLYYVFYTPNLNGVIIKMGTNSEFIKRSVEILDFIDVYGALRLEHIEKIFPHSRKNIGYLIKNQRLYESSDGIYISTDPASLPDKCIVAALGVLADVFDKVKSHAKVANPVQISFITKSDDYYEIIYVGYGMEAMVTANIETQQSARIQNNKYNNITKRIIIVEDKKQMDRLKIPQTTRFALVSPDGSLVYFR